MKQAAHQIAKLQEKIMSCRNDKLHKVYTDLIRKYDVIYCEGLNVKGMARNHHLVKSISDASWGNILEEGIRNISAGTVDYTDGGGVRLARKHFPMKSESHKSLACG